jgi:hypothetical protein
MLAVFHLFSLHPTDFPFCSGKQEPGEVFFGSDVVSINIILTSIMQMQKRMGYLRCEWSGEGS